MATKKRTTLLLTAGEGKYLTNGDVYVKNVLLPAGADATAWREVDEAEKLQAEKETDERV